MTSPLLRDAAASVVKQWRSMSENAKRRMHVDFQVKLSVLERAVVQDGSADLTGPQRAALLFLRDESGGAAYAGKIGRLRRSSVTLRALHRLGLIVGDNGDTFRDDTYVMITPLGRDAIRDLPRSVRR